jgi:hypothetical protein
VEDDPEGETPTGTETADAMSHRYPVWAAGAFDRPVMDREDDGLALPKGDDLAL